MYLRVGASSSCVSMRLALALRFEVMLQHKDRRAGFDCLPQSLVRLLLQPERDRAVGGLSPGRELPGQLGLELRDCRVARDVNPCEEGAQPDLQPPRRRDAREPRRRLSSRIGCCSILVHCEAHLQAARNCLAVGDWLPFVGWLKDVGLQNLRSWRRCRRSQRIFSFSGCAVFSPSHRPLRSNQ